MSMADMAQEDYRDELEAQLEAAPSAPLSFYLDDEDETPLIMVNVQYSDDEIQVTLTPFNKEIIAKLQG